MRNCLKYKQQRQNGISKISLSGNNGTLIDLPLISCMHHSMRNPLIFKLVYKLADALLTVMYMLILNYKKNYREYITDIGL